MKEPSAPTLEELLVELEKTSPQKLGGRTVTEWRRCWGVGETRARELIQMAIQKGRMITTPTLRNDLLRPGRRNMVYLHSFLPKKSRTR